MNISTEERIEQRAATLLVEALEKSWKTYLAELKRCRLEFSNEAVHDLRVATRRSMALIQLLNSIAARPRFKKIMHSFKEQLDELDELRDTQVILVEISESVQDFPQLQRFQKRQKYYEAKLLKSLRHKIRKFPATELTRRIRKTHQAWQDDPPDGLEMRLLQAVDDAWTSARQRLSLVDAARPFTIHRVRIAFKRFRYMVEIVYPLLTDYPVELFRAMHDFQSRMGDVQDADVFLQTLMDYAESASMQDLDPVRRYYERRHADAVRAFMDDSNHLDDLWRATPDQPFPWEKNT